MVYAILILAFFLILDSTGVLKLGSVFKALLQAAAIILVLYVVGLGSLVWLLKKSASIEEDISKERSNQVFNRSNNTTLPDLDKYQVEDKVAKIKPVEMATENKHGDKIKTISEDYKSRIASKVRSNLNLTLCNGVDTNLIYKINISPTGELAQAPQLLKTSGIQSCDDAFERAIRIAEPLPLPPDPLLIKSFQSIKLQFNGNEIELLEPDSEATETSIYTGTIDEIRTAYLKELSKAMSPMKYPKIAAMRGWQGEAILELEFGGNRKFQSKKIVQSSGYDVLDKQALEMVSRTLPVPPKDLYDGKENFTITIPISFKLD